MIASTFSLITGSVFPALVYWIYTESVVAMNLSSNQMKKPCNACFLKLPEQMLLARL